MMAVAIVMTVAEIWAMALLVAGAGGKFSIITNAHVLTARCLFLRVLACA